MYIIVKRETQEPYVINFISENEKNIPHFITPRQAKQFMRARRLSETKYKRTFVTKKEFKKLREYYAR